MYFDRASNIFIVAAVCAQAIGQVLTAHTDMADVANVAALMNQAFVAFAFLAAASLFASFLVPRRTFEALETQESYVYLLKASAVSLLVSVAFFGLAWLSRFVIHSGANLLVFIICCGLLNQVSLSVSLLLLIWAVVSYLLRNRSFAYSEIASAGYVKQKGLFLMKLAGVALVVGLIGVLCLFFFALSTSDPGASAALMMMVTEGFALVLGFSFLIFTIGLIRFFLYFDTPNKGAASWIHFGTSLIIFSVAGIFIIAFAVAIGVELLKLDKRILEYFGDILAIITQVAFLIGCGIIVAGFIRSWLPFGFLADLPIASANEKQRNLSSNK